MGFKPDHFFRKVDENLHCPICHDVFDNPLTCKDGHTFCSECIEKWLQGNTKCPADNRSLNNEALVRNLTVKGIIDNMDVYCDPLCTQKSESSPAKRIKIENSPTDDESTLHNHDDEENCSWTGKLHELETHRKACAFQLVNCPYENCKYRMKRKYLEKHKETCKYKIVVCKECATCVVECKLQDHLENDCPDVMVPCPNNCSTDGEVMNIRRNNLADHLSKVCPKALVDCPYKKQGCVVKVECQDVEKHVQENMAGHMILLAKQCSSLIEHDTLLKDVCSSLVRENAQLSKELSQVKEEFQNQLLSVCSYTWTVQDYPNVSKNHPNGSRIKSPTFWLRGHKWCILLYPNGSTEKEAGFLSLYIMKKFEDDSQASGVSSNKSMIPYRLTVISQMPGTDDVSYCGKHVFTKKEKSWGRCKFMKASDVLSPSYCRNKSLTIQSTIQPDKPQ